MPSEQSGTKPFGQLLRDKRVAKGYSLRRFAQEVGVSPTYLSQVEHGKVAKPPTTERLRRIAELLEENPDEWIASAGRFPDDLPDILRKEPTGIPELLREASGLTAEQLRKVTDHIRRMKEEGI